jgi:hypothetical protein
MLTDTHFHGNQIGFFLCLLFACVILPTMIVYLTNFFMTSGVTTDRAWTDYPITQMGDIPNELAPIRSCRVLAYDGDKYVKILLDGQIKAEIKAGYVYDVPGRVGEVSKFAVDPFEVDTKTWMKI